MHSPQSANATVSLADLAARLRAVTGDAAAEAVLAALDANADAVLAELVGVVRERIPAFSDSRNPDVGPELLAHARAHLVEMRRLVAGGAPGDFEFVRAHARRRAEQHFPLEAMLHAYRCGHRVCARWLRAALEVGGIAAREAVGPVADFAIEYTDVVSTVAAGAYSSHACLLADVEGDQRAQRLSVLLEGADEAEPRAMRILRDAGYLDHTLCYCVAVARAIDPTEMFNAARARRLADACAQACAPKRWRTLVDVRDHHVVMVVADRRRDSGWTAPKQSLARRVGKALEALGNAVVVGVSNDAPSTAHVPAAWREARMALACAGPAARVVAFGTLSLRDMLLQIAGAEFQRVAPAWATALFSADRAQDGALLATLEAYAAANMNVLKAAARLDVHPNTIYARFQRIKDATGLDPRAFADLSDMLLVAAASR